MVLDRLVEALREGVRKVSINQTVLEHHSKALTYHKASTPDVVVFPKSEEELVHVVNIAKQFKKPIVPFGIGTSVEGHIIPYHGGIVVDFSEMNEILSINPEDYTVTAQPGVTREQLNQALKKHGLFFPVDPGANATLGGMTATNASGTNAVKYGTMRQQVRKLRVVLASSEVINVGSAAAKTSAGFALKDLFIGSEGTLGMISEITLKVYGIEEYSAVAKLTFNSLQQASEKTQQILASGLKVSKMELVDAETIDIINEQSQLDLKVAHSLLIELTGSKEEVELDLSLLQSISENSTCELQFETDSLARAKLWQARHNAALSVAAANPGKGLMFTDVCVPLSKLTAAVMHARKVVDLHGIKASIIGHVGDGNFHVGFAIDQNDEEELALMHTINDQIVQFALEVGGTCTGEHGIGVGKKHFLRQEHSTTLEIMKGIKKLLDPDNMFSPGVLFDMD
ncbi:FAD-binding protein [Lysinibacillus yapensis]|uniref:D-lactate dehydrogenase (cytochrome) n=1 Tax=Ureibacillus yapensis TaxID=2304605 RepID=A0A396SCA5_9BACL|nr:FAD-linked oxidase C-terminal domain-containing protein [Lysinibacillus yapensis]RHW38732.1 FAD-binding protein [Lysinibacillus yapensis]